MNTANNVPQKEQDEWVCPHCKARGSFSIIHDAIVKDDFREILCGCMECDGLLIRRYKYVDTIRLDRNAVQ